MWPKRRICLSLVFAYICLSKSLLIRLYGCWVNKMIVLLTACLFFAILVHALNCISKSARENCVKGHSSHLHCASLLRVIYGVISARLCTRILKTWRICLDIELCQLKNGSSSPTSMGTPIFFSSRCNQLIISFAWEKTNLISIAEN